MKIYSLIILILLLFSSCVFFSLIFNYIFEWNRKRVLGKNSIEASEFLNNSSINTSSNLAWLLRNGIPFLKRPCNFLIQNINFIKNYFNDIYDVLKENYNYCNVVSIASLFIFVSILLAIFVSFVFNSIIAGIALFLCICVSLSTWMHSRKDKKKEKIRNDIPDTIRSMSACFGAGYTLIQTFNQLAKESNGEIKKLFNNCCHILQMGGSISESLHCIRSNTDVEELNFIAVALEVQHQTGGSIKPVLDSAKDMIENKLELIRMLHVQTAQAKLSARIVMILPFVLIALFSIISPGFMMPFFTSLLGFLFFLVACVMQAAGLIIIKKMLKVEI